MKSSQIINIRQQNQQLLSPKFKKPAEMVQWMAAIQAQEYAMSKWSIGLRVPGLNDSDVETAFNKGLILRTHLLRPTWHFVNAKDIRWILKLTAPRVHAVNKFMNKKMELDGKILKRTDDILGNALSGGKHLTRDALAEILAKKKIAGDGVRISLIMMHAELEGVICSGPRVGKQFTYGLIDERAPDSIEKSTEESLAELTKRYFKSRGPATLKDYSTWSGLTSKQVTEGFAMVQKDFETFTFAGKEKYIHSGETNPDKRQATFLMPDYDEYGMGYKDRTGIFSQESITAEFKRNNPIFDRMIIIEGRIAGTWRRTLKKNGVIVDTVPFSTLSASRKKLMYDAVKRYSTFIGKSTEE